MAQVVAAEPALDVRDRGAQRAAHQRAEHGRHRVPVDEHERRARSRSRSARRSARGRRTRSASRVASQPGMSEFTRRSRPRAPRASQRSGCRRPNCSRKAGICCDLLAGRREQIADGRARSSRSSTGASLISSPVVPNTTRITVDAREPLAGEHCQGAPHACPVRERRKRDQRGEREHVSNIGRPARAATRRRDARRHRASTGAAARAGARTSNDKPRAHRKEADDQREEAGLAPAVRRRGTSSLGKARCRRTRGGSPSADSRTRISGES